MRLLELHHITNFYYWVETELFPLGTTVPVGRPPTLSVPETITILVWNVFTIRQKTLKDIFEYTRIHLRSEFPKLGSYRAFVDCCHRALESMLSLLNSLLDVSAPYKILDSTMLQVCKIVRASHHKVAKNIASFGRNHQGWHFGFKMHTSINLLGHLTGVVFTTASVYDAQMMEKLINEKTKVAVGDSHYGASVMGRRINELYGTAIVAPPHHSQKKKILTELQLNLLRFRPRIESVFDYLKEHLNLVTSFPRSIKGYFLHYVRILLGYQMQAFLCGK